MSSKQLFTTTQKRSIKQIALFKEKYGSVPYSVMKFKKTDELMELIDYDSSEMGTTNIIRRGGGWAKKLRYSIYNPDQAFFILDYFTQPGYHILDPFMGRGTRSQISIFLDRKYTGFDVCQETVKYNQYLSDKNKVDKSSYRFFNSDGCKMTEIQGESFDAVFTCPPYYDAEKYSNSPGDLSWMSIDDFNINIQLMFDNIFKLIKTSSYDDRKFYPVIITVGTYRMGDKGIIDMDYEFQRMATKSGLVLHDKLITVNNSPAAGFTVNRNSTLSFLTKIHETTLVFLKY